MPMSRTLLLLLPLLLQPSLGLIVSPSPTVTPSDSPTALNPTVAPTFTPTVATPAPTGFPTVYPTASPTASPTTSPTTPAPTGFPTVSPTVSPTASPTASPTTAPTTLSPSVSPTASTPTNAPTTGSPSVSPTVSPTVGTAQFASFALASVNSVNITEIALIQSPLAVQSTVFFSTDVVRSTTAITDVFSGLNTFSYSSSANQETGLILPHFLDPYTTSVSLSSALSFDSPPTRVRISLVPTSAYAQAVQNGTDPRNYAIASSTYVTSSTLHSTNPYSGFYIGVKAATYMYVDQPNPYYLVILSSYYECLEGSGTLFFQIIDLDSDTVLASEYGPNTTFTCPESTTVEAEFNLTDSALLSRNLVFVAFMLNGTATAPGNGENLIHAFSSVRTEQSASSSIDSLTILTAKSSTTANGKYMYTTTFEVTSDGYSSMAFNIEVKNARTKQTLAKGYSDLGPVTDELLEATIESTASAYPDNTEIEIRLVDQTLFALNSTLAKSHSYALAIAVVTSEGSVTSANTRSGKLSVIQILGLVAVSAISLVALFFMVKWIRSHVVSNTEATSGHRLMEDEDYMELERAQTLTKLNANTKNHF